MKGGAMFHAECDIAALVYDADHDPDAVLRDFAADLNAHGYRAVGMVQAGQCADSSLSAVFLHNGEKLLLSRDSDPNARGCQLDVDRLQRAGQWIASALDAGADVLVINRFGKRERDGKGLLYLIDRAINANLPVVIAVSSRHFAEWVKFAGGMTVKLPCDRHALDTWWHNASARSAGEASQSLASVEQHPTAR
jgi:nucleoside-triphosphatase THEP1